MLVTAVPEFVVLGVVPPPGASADSFAYKAPLPDCRDAARPGAPGV